MDLAVTSGLSRTCAVSGPVTHYTYAHDQVTSERRSYTPQGTKGVIDRIEIPYCLIISFKTCPFVRHLTSPSVSVTVSNDVLFTEQLTEVGVWGSGRDLP
jgi:hypothetical protein